MRIVKLIQGTPEWHAHRASHFNASDTPAMLGISPYKTRQQLLREYASGIAEEIDAETQKRFDEGHRLEALSRPVAEEIVGEDLFPCVGVNGHFSASFDGITLLHDTAFEHKTLNAELREILSNSHEIGPLLPEHYRAQMEHQCMVSGAERVLFMAARSAARSEHGESVERYWTWYSTDSELRDRIVRGWAQFAVDVENFKANPVATPTPSPVGRAPESLPALRIEVSGMVTASNLEEFKARAVTVFRNIRSDLQTDQDFADAEKTVKWCIEIEDKLEAAKTYALAQTESIDALFRAIDEISAEARAKRLELDRIVKARKEAVRVEIVAEAANAVRAHINAINTTLGEHALGVPASLQAEIGAAIKGKKTLTSITDAAQTAAANAKIAASQQAERIRACIAVLDGYGDYAHLFDDRVSLCASKSPDDLRNLAATRVQSEQDRLQREAEAKAEAEAKSGRAGAVGKVVPKTGEAPARAPAHITPQVGEKTPMLRIGEINARIAPLSITAEGISALGFMPAEIHGVTKYYRTSDFSAIRDEMVRILQAAA